MKSRQWDPINDTPQLVKWLEEDPTLLGGIGASGTSMDVVTAYMFEQTMTPRSHFVAVEDDDGNLIGMFAATSIDPDGAAMGLVLASPKYKGRGGWIEKEGLRYAGEKLGLKQVLALVSIKEPMYRGLHIALGFKPTGMELLVYEVG